MEKIYTLQEVAVKLRVSERTIFRYLKSGKLRGSKIGAWRFSETDITNFLQSLSNNENTKSIKNEQRI